MMDGGIYGDMMAPNREVIELAELAAKLRDDGIPPDALFRAGVFILCFYAYEINLPRKQIIDIIDKVMGKFHVALNESFVVEHPKGDTEQ
jgi:hypothetical protein